MAEKTSKVDTTQRAYTLRLNAIHQNAELQDRLWKTHEAVNAGAQVFGNALLTLRGGIDHSLAGEDKNNRELLVLSWLSVESKLQAPLRYIVAEGTEVKAARDTKVIAALKEILENRSNLSKHCVEKWVEDSKSFLCAPIRDDAVWVNRSKMFDDFQQEIGKPVTSDDIWDMLLPFFGGKDDYLNSKKKNDQDSASSKKEKNLAKAAGDFLSKRFGNGKGADFEKISENYQKISKFFEEMGKDKDKTIVIYRNLAKELGLDVKNDDEKIDTYLKYILKSISRSGSKSGIVAMLTEEIKNEYISDDKAKNISDKAKKDGEGSRAKIGMKGAKAYADFILKKVQDSCRVNYLTKTGSNHHAFTVMLDHAARHVVVANSWIKLAQIARQNFEADAKCLSEVPPKAKNWLDDFCAQRAQDFGAIEAYRIRPSAVTGWEKVVKGWDKLTDKDARIEHVKKLQADPSIDKFGDAALFEALTDDDAKVIWMADDKVNWKILSNYVKGTNAEFKKGQFKVPAYRHPDALLHPVFCDFGKSRLGIKYSAKEPLNQSKESLEKQKKEEVGKDNRPVQIVTLGLLTDDPDMDLLQPKRMRIVLTDMHWQSKRMRKDLLVSTIGHDGITTVSRADRLGRVAVGVQEGGMVRVAGLPDQKYWTNGRLQAPREQLEAIAKIKNGTHLSEEEKNGKLKKIYSKLRWSLTFSAKLEKQGPWMDLVKKDGNNDLNANPTYWPFKNLNQNRKGNLAKLILSRIPGLRILSVDLGHRYASACAVWEVASTSQLEEDSAKAKEVVRDESDLYRHLKHEAKGKGIGKTIIYRRIGADCLSDGSKHPAPWAKLDRQFLIKLQGEENVRPATPLELQQVKELEAEQGKKTADTENRGHQDVSELTFSAVKTLKNALKRHGDRARIACALHGKYKTLPGDKKYYFMEGKDQSIHSDEAKRQEEYQKHLTNALLIWHKLINDPFWEDKELKTLWEVLLQGVTQPYDVNALKIEDASIEETSAKQKQERIKEQLRGIANELARNTQKRNELYEKLTKYWHVVDGQLQTRIRWLSRWLLPRKRPDALQHRVGGLSLTRLSNIIDFRRKVQVGFFTRLHPDGSYAPLPEAFSSRALDTLEQLREQRVKQLASRIVEAALGAGRIKQSRNQSDMKRPSQKVDEPCHAIIIENLTNYRPDELQTRRENRQIMSWSSAKVKKYLEDGCELHGLHLREVSPSYTSRQDSRTGAPGIRCQDISVYDFMTKPYLKKQCETSAKKINKNKGSAIDNLLHDLYNLFSKSTSKEWKEMKQPIRIPVSGGEIFVSSSKRSSASRGLQADLNAAANIGLRAILDPDWVGKWWRVPCQEGTFKPNDDSVLGSDVFKDIKCLKPAPENSSISKSKKIKDEKQEESIVNLWHDISSTPLKERDSANWLVYVDYIEKVQSQVVDILRIQNQWIENLSSGRLEDIPF